MGTVFDRLVTKENDHTTLLRNLMDRHPKLAAAILSSIVGRPVEDSEAATFHYYTQQLYISPDGREIPDVVIAGNNFHCIIEVKIDPNLDLTEGQRRGYTNCFLDQAIQSLTFLVPNDWKYADSIEEVRVKHSPRTTVTLLCWERLIAIAQDVSKMHPDAILSDAVEFWKWRFQSIRMTEEERQSLQEWSRSRYIAIRKLQKTIDQTKKLFDARDFETNSWLADTDEYGFFIKRGGKYLLWIGIWAKATAPMCFGYSAGKSTWLKPTFQPEHPIDGEGGFYHWLLESDHWDDPEKICSRVSSFMEKYWPVPSTI